MQFQGGPSRANQRRLPRLILTGLVTLVLTLASGGLVAFGAFHNNGQDGLAAVGPIAADTGFPVWYRDTRGVRLEACLDIDTHCLLASADVPDASAPLSVYSGNFPGEIFWFAADSIFATPSGLDAALTLALEGAFASGETPIPGDQVAFGRVRIRISNLLPGQSYTITHPYGTNTFVADPDPKNAALGEINFTEDIGIGAWSGPLSSRIGPFLTAVSPAPPQGYIGSPQVEQTVTGSPYNTNYFMIQGPGVRAAGDSNACPADISNSDTTCAYSDLFSLAGKYATNAGVDIATVLYSRDGAGNTTLNVYATSEAAQAIQVDGDSFYRTNAASNGGEYYARIELGNQAPQVVSVTNTSDNPPASKTAFPLDIVTISRAEYDTATGTLSIEASSSDAFEPPALTLEGYGVSLSGGSVAVEELPAPPLYATVRSARGGWDTEQVRVVGPGYEALPVQAVAGPIQSVTGGAAVALDGTDSMGEVASYQWEQVDNGAPPVSLNNAATAIATFVAPANQSDTDLALLFRLTVTGPGGPNSAEVEVVVRAGNVPPQANAGPDQTVMRSSSVTVDASGTTNALSYSWSQVSGPAVSISNATSARASFVMPYTATPGVAVPVVLRVEATGPGGTAADEVTVTPLVDDVVIASAQYTRSSREWRVRGTDTLIGYGNQVAIYRGTTCEVGGASNTNLVARVTVDNTGAWEFRGTAGAPDGTNRISVCSLGGDRQLNFQVRIR